MTTQIVDQPPPTRSDRPSILALVRADLEDRERVGVERYGTPLQAFNGRNALVDAYQEVLDLAAYLRQALVEQEERRALADLAGGMRAAVERGEPAAAVDALEAAIRQWSKP